MIKSRPASVGEINRSFNGNIKRLNSLSTSMLTKANLEHTKAVSGTYAIISTDTIILASGTFSVSLPEAVSDYRVIEVNNIGTGRVTVLPVSGEYINGSASMGLVRYDSMRIIEGSTGWVVI